ncbi:MAG: hypothetical protein E6Q97_15650 [Desulfurellales bacterium]|nr:MAG: hypothetical protein E6Q97_15650 [Desulfurellales bacterium]
MSASGLRKQLFQMIEAEPGWKFIGPTKSGHLKFQHENGAIAYTSGSPSDRRSILNLRSDMRRLAREPKRCSG